METWLSFESMISVSFDGMAQDGNDDYYAKLSFLRDYDNDIIRGN